MDDKAYVRPGTSEGCEKIRIEKFSIFPVKVLDIFQNREGYEHEENNSTDYTLKDWKHS